MKNTRTEWRLLCQNIEQTAKFIVQNRTIHCEYNTNNNSQRRFFNHRIYYELCESIASYELSHWFCTAQWFFGIILLLSKFSYFFKHGNQLFIVRYVWMKPVALSRYKKFTTQAKFILPRQPFVRWDVIRILILLRT